MVSYIKYLLKDYYRKTEKKASSIDNPALFKGKDFRFVGEVTDFLRKYNIPFELAGSVLPEHPGNSILRRRRHLTYLFRKNQQEECKIVGRKPSEPRLYGQRQYRDIDIAVTDIPDERARFGISYLEGISKGKFKWKDWQITRDEISDGGAYVWKIVALRFKIKNPQTKTLIDLVVPKKFPQTKTLFPEIIL